MRNFHSFDFIDLRMICKKVPLDEKTKSCKIFFLQFLCKNFEILAKNLSALMRNFHSFDFIDLGSICKKVPLDEKTESCKIFFCNFYAKILRYWQKT